MKAIAHDLGRVLLATCDRYADGLSALGVRCTGTDVAFAYALMLGAAALGVLAGAL